MSCCGSLSIIPGASFPGTKRPEQAEEKDAEVTAWRKAPTQKYFLHQKHNTDHLRPPATSSRETIVMFYDPASLADGLDGAITPNNGKKRGRPPAAVWNNFTGVGEVKSSTKRRPACCNFCKFLIVDSRVEALLKHIVRDCTKTTPEARQQADADLQARNDAAAAAAAAGPSAPGSKVKTGGPKPKLGQALALAVPGGQVGNAGVESRELRFLLLHDLPLAVADSPALLDLVRALRPRHGLADANRLRSTVVNDEYGKMLANATKSVAAATCVTLAASNTVLVGHQHVLGCSVHLAGQTSTLLHVLEAPSDAFAPGELFGMPTFLEPRCSPFIVHHFLFAEQDYIVSLQQQHWPFQLRKVSLVALGPFIRLCCMSTGLLMSSCGDKGTQ